VVFAFGDARQTIREGAEGWRRELGHLSLYGYGGARALEITGTGF
jgi:hypothetical protein